MDFPAPLFPAAMLWFANLLLAVVAVAALWRAQLRLILENRFAHVFFGACVVILMLWNTGVGVLPALNFHLLGLTAVTLMFGWAYAVLAVLLVAIGTVINQGGAWESLGLNALVTGCIPVAVTQMMLQFAQKRLPHNFFVYVYVNGFLAAGISIVAVCCVGAALMLIADTGSAGWLRYQFYPYLPLISFSEAITNGMVITALVALRPAWVASFDDNLYLRGK
ncbi:MAG: energy-coupling factor ABC transporter permease [Thiogranum sp.]|nr:energy-coupling factor ABC transporter permease [Thiogranum sp.]